MKITGKIASGLGEGKFFLSMEHYRNEIRKNLGMDVYPGTLNIETETSYNFKSKPIRIEGYAKDGKTYGGATCYLAKIKGKACAIIVPDLTRHGKNTVELIANVHLRSELNLKDEDVVEVTL